MTSRVWPKLTRAAMSGLAIAAIAGTSVTSFAQNDDEQTRIRKLEAEVRALQRKVFPGDSGRFFEPEITAAATTPTNSSAASTTAVTDILARMDALETQLQSLTSRSEENGNSLRLLTTRLAALEVTSNAAMAAGATADGSGGFGTPTSTPAPSPALATVNRTVMAATPATAAAASRPAITAPGPTAERLAAVQQIAKPQTDDAGDDEYSYGFRLWDAGFFPEAQQQLSLFVEKYPSHPRASFGRNLLGRAFLDDGKAREAAPWFLQNYQSDKQASRAPDSLLFLGEAMISMGDTSRACIALAEFGDTYPALAAGRLSDRYQANLGKVSCN